MHMFQRIGNSSMRCYQQKSTRYNSVTVIARSIVKRKTTRHYFFKLSYLILGLLGLGLGLGLDEAPILLGAMAVCNMSMTRASPSGIPLSSA